MHPIEPHLFARGGFGMLSQVAQAYMEDDHDDLGGIVADCAEENLYDAQDRAMLELEVGKTYLFKTFGLFYEGTVEKETRSLVLLRNVRLVVDVGETNAVFQGNADYSYSERFPEDTKVRLNPLHIYAAEERVDFFDPDQ